MFLWCFIHIFCSHRFGCNNSINILTSLCSQVSSFSSLCWMRATQSQTIPQSHTHTFRMSTWLSLDCGKKPEVLEKPHQAREEHLSWKAPGQIKARTFLLLHGATLMPLCCLWMNLSCKHKARDILFLQDVFPRFTWGYLTFNPRTHMSIKAMQTEIYQSADSDIVVQ